MLSMYYIIEDKMKDWNNFYLCETFEINIRWE